MIRSTAFSRRRLQPGQQLHHGVNFNRLDQVEVEAADGGVLSAQPVNTFRRQLAALFGPSLVKIRQYLAWLVGRADNAIEFARPKSQAHWGVVSIATSFALLAIGALVSLKKREGSRGSA